MQLILHVDSLQSHNYLQILGKPVITEEPRDVEISFGNTVYFSCKAEGDPIPNIVWLHNRFDFLEKL